MAIGLNDTAIRQTVLDAMSTGTPLATYRKAVKGRVLVRYLDPIRLLPLDVILKGDPDDPATLEEDYIVSVWSEAEEKYIRKQNRAHFSDGVLIAHRGVAKTDYLVNQISDADLEDLVTKPFMTLKAKMAQFTSTVPVRRMLAIAEKLNRPIKTINFIKESLSGMEQKEDPTSLTAPPGEFEVVEVEL